MARGWMSLVLMVGWLAACSSALAQPLPGPKAVVAPPSGPPPELPAPPGPPASPGDPSCPPAACPPDCNGPHGPECDPGSQLSIAVDYLLLYIRKAPFTPLATSGSFADAIPGGIGQPNTRVLVNSGAGEEQRSGLRLTLGYSFDPEQLWAVDASFFALERRRFFTEVIGTGANGSDVIARPFFNVNAGVEDADPVAVPNVMNGRVSFELPSRLTGADTNLRFNYSMDRSRESRITMLVGIRWLWLDEDLRISQTSADLPGLGVPGNIFRVNETFATSSNFYGGQVGAEYESRVGRVTWRLLGKLALGQTYQEVKNSASTSVTDLATARTTTSNNRGLLVQPSNAGSFSREEFSVVPEVAFDVGYEFNEHVRLRIGYQFLYWDHVLRPGRQIDRAINIQALQPFDQVGPARPAPILQSDAFWVHGLSVRFEVVF